MVSGDLEPSVDAFRDLHAVDINRQNGHGRLNGYGAAHADGNALTFFFVVIFVVEGKHLPKASYIEPLLAGFARIALAVFPVVFAQLFLRAFFQTVITVVRAFSRLNENFLSKVLPAVADFAFQANVGNLAIAVVILAGTIAIQRIAIGIGVIHRQYYGKIDFVLQN